MPAIRRDLCEAANSTLLHGPSPEQRKPSSEGPNRRASFRNAQ